MAANGTTCGERKRRRADAQTEFNNPYAKSTLTFLRRRISQIRRQEQGGPTVKDNATLDKRERPGQPWEQTQKVFGGVSGKYNPQRLAKEESYRAREEQSQKEDRKSELEKQDDPYLVGVLCEHFKNTPTATLVAALGQETHQKMLFFTRRPRTSLIIHEKHNILEAILELEFPAHQRPSNTATSETAPTPENLQSRRIQATRAKLEKEARKTELVRKTDWNLLMMLNNRLTMSPAAAQQNLSQSELSELRAFKESLSFPLLESEKRKIIEGILKIEFPAPQETGKTATGDANPQTQAKKTIFEAKTVEAQLNEISDTILIGNLLRLIREPASSLFKQKTSPAELERICGLYSGLYEPLTPLEKKMLIEILVASEAIKYNEANPQSVKLLKFCSF
jgi:hypothetical protein